VKIKLIFLRYFFCTKKYQYSNHSSYILCNGGNWCVGCYQ